MPTFHVTAPDGHVLEITGPEGSTQDQAIEQAKKQYQPKRTDSSVAPPDEGRTLKDFVTSPHGFIREGLGRAGRGVMGAINTPGLDSKFHGASEVIRGLGTAAIPAAIPFAAVSPLTSAAALAAGTGAQYAGEEGSKALGAPPGASALIGDVAGLGAGGLTGKKMSGLDLPSVPRAASAVGKGLKVAAPGLAGGAAMIGGGEILSQIPGMGEAARFGLGYPGARQIGKSIHEGFNVARNNFGNSKSVTPPGPPSNKWMQGDVNVKPDLSDVQIGPVGKPTLPSGRMVGKPVIAPNAAPEVQPTAPVTEPSTQVPPATETPQATPKAQETAPEKATSEPVKDMKSEENDPNKQYSWAAIKEKYGQDRVDTTKAKLKDLSDRLKAAEIPLDKFLKLPQEAQDAIVKIPKHATQTNRPKYSSGFHKGYSDLLKELHGQSE